MISMRKSITVLGLAALLAGCATETANYTISSTETYFVLGEQCTQYNVIVDDADLSDKDLTRIYGEVLSEHKDRLYQHRVAFYSDEEAIESGDYDVALITEVTGNDYEIERP